MFFYFIQDLNKQFKEFFPFYKLERNVFLLHQIPTCQSLCVSLEFMFVYTACNFHLENNYIL